MENFNLMDINIYFLNNKFYKNGEKYIFDRKKSKPKGCIFAEPDPAPDPLFHEPNPRIWIYIKMKLIRNTGL